jgi:hypothetical protein
MPDFMKGLAKGIEENRPLVQKAMGNVSSDMSVEPNAGEVNLKLPTLVGDAPVNAGASLLTLLRSLMGPTEELTSALKARFQNPGVYLVKGNGRLHRIAVK